MKLLDGIVQDSSEDQRARPSSQEYIEVEYPEEHQYQGHWNDPGYHMVTGLVHKDSPEGKEYLERGQTGGNNQGSGDLTIIIGLCCLIGLISSCTIDSAIQRHNAVIEENARLDALAHGPGRTTYGTTQPPQKMYSVP